MTTIYFNETPLYISNTETSFLKSFKGQPDTYYNQQLNGTSLNNILDAIKNNEIRAAVFAGPDGDVLLEQIKNTFKIIVAGGGWVLNNTGEVLFILRHGKWDLPKGKLDEGETIEACAIREVEEETGVSGLSILQPLMITYHVYEHKGQEILKESHWFLMKTVANNLPEPQLEEGITTVEWLDKAGIQKALSNTYPSIKDLAVWADQFF